MVEQTVQWEYRVLTIGSAVGGAKDGQVEATLNDWGLEGWEAVNVVALANSFKLTLVAKRQATAATRRLRSMPQ